MNDIRNNYIADINITYPILKEKYKMNDQNQQQSLSTLEQLSIQTVMYDNMIKFAEAYKLFKETNLLDYLDIITPIGTVPKKTIISSEINIVQSKEIIAE